MTLLLEDGGQPSDRIEVRGLELLLYCGVLPEEKERRQPFRFDLDLYHDLRTAGSSDALADTADYGSLTDTLVETLTGDRFQLLERLAQRTADLVFESTDVAEVTVGVHKLRPPVAAHVASTGVRIHRVRPV